MSEIEISESRAKRNVLLTAVIAAIGGLLFGYDTGIIASALLFIKSDFGLNSFQQGVVVAAVPIGAVFGAALAGQFSDRYGRRMMILIGALLFVVGSIVSALAPGAEVLVIARLFIGFAIGLASAACPVYVSEVAPSELRGRLVTLFQLAVTVGILVAYLVGLAFEPSGSWEGMLAVGAIPGLLLAIGIAVSPSSPRWLVMNGRSEEARTELHKIRFDAAGIDDEMKEIEQTITEEKGSWKDMRLPAVRAALVVGVGLAVLQQVTGINTVIYYAPTIVQTAGINSDSAAILASIGVGVVNVAATVWALWLVSKHGRRPLLVVGVSGMVIALILLGASFEIGNGDLVTAIAIGSLMLYVAAFAISLGPIFWILNSEIYPLKARGHASGIGTMANWTSNFIVSLTFLPLISLLGSAITFWFYAAVGLFTVYFCLKFVPETKGKHLEEIEAIFEDRAGEKVA